MRAAMWLAPLVVMACILSVHAAVDPDYRPTKKPAEEAYVERSQSFTEVTTEPAPKPSSGGSGLFSTVFGLAFLLGGVVLLFMSEGSTVKHTLAAAEVRRTARSVERPLGEPDPALEGKLVHIAAPAATEDRLEDAEFGLSGAQAVNALGLKREVKMWQWHEVATSSEEKKADGSVTKTTRYQYKQDWSAAWIDSSRFRNPPSPPNPPFQWEQRTVYAPNVTVGPYSFSEQQIAGAIVFQPLNLFAPDARAAPRSGPVIPGPRPPHLRGPAGEPARNTLYRRRGQPGVLPPDDPVLQPTTGRMELDMMFSPPRPVMRTVDWATLVSGNPQIGDCRITFSAARPGELVCAIGRQTGNRLTPYVTRTGIDMAQCRAGGSDLQRMMDDYQWGTNAWKWIARVFSFLLLWFALGLCISPIVSWVSPIPFVGNVVSIVATASTFFVSLTLTLATVALAWLWWRPLHAVVLLAAAWGVARAFAK